MDYKKAINYAVSQVDAESGEKINLDNKHMVTHYVRQYFNKNDISYEDFSYVDLKPYITEVQQ